MLIAKTYPLIFTFPDAIVGRGFVALVELHGHALLMEEHDGDMWLYGVQPGSVSGGGKDYPEACREFKKNYLSVLFDLAAESPTFEDFSSQVHGFFGAVNYPNAADWATALEAVRKTNATPAGFPTAKADFHPPAIKVDRRHV